MSFRVAILGATGLVGQTLLSILEERSFPVSELLPLASARSAGASVSFRGEAVVVQEAVPDAFEGVDIVLSSAGASVSRRLLPEAARRGAVSVDNTSAYRMDPAVPLVVPEVNAHRIPEYGEQRILANPNCSTIQLVLVLKPLLDTFGLRRVVVSTYQSSGGAGAEAMRQLEEDSRADLAGEPLPQRGDDAAFPSTLAFDCLPQIDVFREAGETKEEEKMRRETPKILEVEVPLSATCVRVPVRIGHSEAVWVETEKEASPQAVRELLATAPGVAVVDDPSAALASGRYPTARAADGRDPVYVGRIRRDTSRSDDHGLALWVVADNIRKGAALNAVQVAEGLVEHWRQHGRS
ncbi:MAG: aspartate-semialdehyde dehydrogenase [Acidobacteriota bacterium]